MEALELQVFAKEFRVSECHTVWPCSLRMPHEFVTNM